MRNRGVGSLTHLRAVYTQIVSAPTALCAQHFLIRKMRPTMSPLLLAMVAVLAVVPAPSAALRILGVFPFPAHSHSIMFQAFGEGLVERGHEVVLLTSFPTKKAIANLTEIDTSRGRPPLLSAMSIHEFEKNVGGLPGSYMYAALKEIEQIAGNDLCRNVFTMPEFDELMRGGYGRFDVVLTEIFGSDCWAAVPYKLGLPVISMSSAPDVAWLHDRIGSVDNPSYINNVLSDLPNRMTLWQRLDNTVTNVFIKYLFKSFMQDGSDPVVREFFGPDVPPLRELVKNTTLVLLNRHVGIHDARPVVPNLVHVGGLHIKPPPGKLDPELRRWMDEAKHGVIFFSLGSLIRGASMRPGFVEAMLGAFAKLPQRVLWKYEDDGLNLPPNVRVAKWLSQMDILNHPKTLLFITHGGLMGTLESIHSSVPMLGIPLFGDQMTNIKTYMSLGIADHLDHTTVTSKDVLTKITNMVSKPRYRERSREVATLFRDRPRSAMDEAVWWVEYVVRHNGAPHLRPLSADMPLYQYLLLDVVALAVVLALVPVVSLTVLLLWAIRVFTASPPPAASKNGTAGKKKMS